MIMALPSSTSGHCPEVSLSHITSYLSTMPLGVVQEREMVVGVVESTITTGGWLGAVSVQCRDVKWIYH